MRFWDALTTGLVKNSRGLRAGLMLTNMGTHMKTTIDIADALLIQAKRVSRRERTTLRALMEEGLRRILVERDGRHKFKLKDASFTGKGLQPEFKGAGWEQIREAIYKGRGT